MSEVSMNKKMLIRGKVSEVVEYEIDGESYYSIESEIDKGNYIIIHEDGAI